VVGDESLGDNDGREDELSPRDSNRIIEYANRNRCSYEDAYQALFGEGSPHDKENAVSVSRHQYRRDMEAAVTCLNDLQERLADMNADKVRLGYRAALKTLRDDHGYDVDVEEEMGELPDDIDEARVHADRRIDQIAYHYRRDETRPVAYAASSYAAVRTDEQCRRAVGYATANKCSSEQACSALGFSA